MKHKRFSLHHHSKKNGFALVASLTLMMLLGLIAVGVLAITTTQNRLASHASLQMEARQQALIGLDAALAEMQIALGPDQRVTASSGILSERADAPQHILGVWDSWTTALYSRQNGSIKDTYTEGRANKFRRWLISSRNPQELSMLESAKTLGTSRPGVRICLVGPGTLGARANKNQYIYADMIEMPASQNNIGCFAWWVSGENQKANIAVNPRKDEAKDDVDILRRTWDTPPPSFEGVESLTFLDTLTTEQKDKMLTRNSMRLINGSSQADDALFYNVTLRSQSLLTNVRDGGLKHDLNMLLSKESLKNTPYAAREQQDCPIADDRDIPTGTEQNMPIGSWQVMHAYYHTWPNGSEKGDEDFTSRLVGSVTEASTRMCGDLIDVTTPKGDKVTYYDNRAKEGDKRAGYARTPILTTFLGCWGLTVRKCRWPSKMNTLHYLYSPMIMWWNPYNVRMKVGAKKLWCYALPYRTTSIQAWSDKALHVNRERPWTSRLLMHPCTGKGVGLPWQCISRLDWGNYFINSVTDTTGDIIFEPGEILAFTMSGDIVTMNDTDDVGEPQDCPFIMGDQPDLMTNYCFDYHEYVNLTNPNAANILYDAYIDKFTARLSFENRKQPFFHGSLGYGISTDEYQGDFLVTMGEVLVNGSVYEDATHNHDFGREAFCVHHGFDGVYVTRTSSIEEKRMKGEVDRFNGAKGISPSAFTLGWYDYDELNGDEMEFLNTKWSLDMFNSLANYYVAVGIVPKSYNNSVNEAFPLFKGKDFRTKVWQHSSPALWASTLSKPDDQMRQYHPYQLAAIELGSGVNRGPLDTVNGRNGVYGLFSAGVGGGENVSFISVLELPYHPPFSLAGFAGMRLTPGWFKESKGTSAVGESIARMRRMQYQAGVPGVGIGNSFADPCLPADEVYVFHENEANNSQNLQSRIFSDYYDHALLINDALWDRWFCSSVSDMPQKTSGVINKENTFTDFAKGEGSLPVSRYKLNLNGQNTDQVVKRILANDGWLHIARYLVIEGGFNINSVSEEAWAATLQGLAKRDLLSNAGGKIKRIDKADNEVLFSRFMVSTANKAINNSSYSPLQGSASVRPSMRMAAAWGEVRALNPQDIRELARQMVKIVRERGPFLNMSDFINRRLDGGSDTALTGALQAAIDATDINAMFRDSDYNVKPQTNGRLYAFSKAAEGSMYTAAPGYLIQSDVLASLGNILTVRDDTFVVRAYGCVRTSRRVIRAQAWCEATVQRTIDYVDPTNVPEDSDRPESDPQKNGATRKLTDINRVMGRKLRIISFRWLDKWDI